MVPYFSVTAGYMKSKHHLSNTQSCCINTTVNYAPLLNMVNAIVLFHTQYIFMNMSCILRVSIVYTFRIQTFIVKCVIVGVKY